MKKFYLLLIAIFTISFANAQWVQTSLDSGYIRSLAVKGDTIFAGSYPYGLYMSINDGTSWTHLNASFTNSSTVNALVISDTNIFAGSTTGVFLSTNNGNNWTAMNTGLTNIGSFGVSAFAKSGSNIFTGTYANGVFLSINNGGSWTSVNSGLNINVSSLEISGNNIFAGTSGGGVFLSTNNGSSWTAVNTGLTGSTMLIHAIAVLGNKIFAGTSNGEIYLSTNNGGNWTQVNTGIPSVSMTISSFAINGNNIFAGTWGDGSGMFMSTNFGQQWINVNEGLVDSVHTLAINGNYIFAGTQQGGVWRRPLSDFAMYNNIEDISANKEISLYPNPTKDNLTIETNSITEQRIEILNLIGQTVYTIYINKKATINTSAFANGVYILKLSSDKETVVRKFVKE